MADTLTNITTFVNSPPGQLLAGVTLAGIVWKFFERVESVLRGETKTEIARWLLGVKTAEKVQPWPDTFAKVFDRVFGKKHLSWKCFWRSALASYALVVPFGVRDFFAFGAYQIGGSNGTKVLIVVVGCFTVLCNVVPDYISLLETRLLLDFMKRKSVAFHILSLVVDFVCTAALALGSTLLGTYLVLRYAAVSEPFSRMIHVRDALAVLAGSNSSFIGTIVTDMGAEDRLTIINSPALLAGMWFFPAFFTSIWLWLYAGSGFLLKFARRFDIGFQWFNSKADIENKPLQSIGLVAGALVAVVYWTWVIGSRMLNHG